MNADGYENLQQSVRAGQAVFFFGAGMSIDGEGNTADRLIRRLLIRFRSMTCALTRLKGEHAALAIGLRRDFFETFGIGQVEWVRPRSARSKNPPPAPSVSFTRYLDRKFINTLCERYYDFNEWICLAYQSLLGWMSRMPDDALGLLLWRISHHELRWLGRLGKGDVIPFQPIDLDLIKAASAPAPGSGFQAGKALFLDTMGFRQPRIMGGRPLDELTAAVLDSYRDKLQERHWVVARFAREGWCPLLVTTNFDRLLEGAFRLSGFRPVDFVDRQLPPVTVPAWVTVASPTAFFTSAGKGRTATILKLHGCAREYEERRKGDWQGYLRRMVFTFREIQNWREDAWSRDFLRTLLRSRVMVFCGYSTRDPVIHDTLRSVYEEMFRERIRDPGPAPASKASTPAFVLAAGKADHDFHGLEVLRAASAAAEGKNCGRRADHPHYLRHGFRTAMDGHCARPDTDDVFLWTYHRAYREAQKEWLRQEIRSTMVSALPSRPDEREITGVIEAFDRRCDEEMKLGTALMQGPTDQGELYRIIRWTYRFHPALLREFACIEAAQRGAAYRGWAREMRATEHYYFPASARPSWTVWTVLVELALSRIAREIGWRAMPGLSDRPAVLLQRTQEAGEPGPHLPRELIIRQAALPGEGIGTRSRGARMLQTIWELGPSCCPWPVTEKEGGVAEEFRRPFHRAKGKAPLAPLLWKWAAAGKLGENDVQNARRWAGLGDRGEKP